jgi:hypothetical protein
MVGVGQEPMHDSTGSCLQGLWGCHHRVGGPCPFLEFGVLFQAPSGLQFLLPGELAVSWGLLSTPQTLWQQGSFLPPGQPEKPSVHDSVMGRPLHHLHLALYWLEASARLHLCWRGGDCTWMWLVSHFRTLLPQGSWEGAVLLLSSSRPSCRCAWNSKAYIFLGT